MNEISSAYRPEVMPLDDAVTQLDDVTAIRLIAAANTARPAPDFIFAPAVAPDMAHFHNDQYTPAVSVFVARNIEVAGPWFITGALLLRDGLTFRCNEIALDPCNPDSLSRLAAHTAAKRDGTRTARKISRPSLLLATNGHQTYGHWLIDFLPKLYLLERAGIQIEDINILLPTNMGKFGSAFLDLLGFKTENVTSYDPDTDYLIVEELVIPTVLRWGGRFSPLFADAVAYLDERIDLHNRVPIFSGSRNIFIARTPGQHGRPIVNYQDIEAMATKADFLVVHPETLPLLHQIALFRHTRRMIGQYGSALHGSIFSRPGICVGSLHGPLPATFDVVQSGIGERLGQKTAYVMGSSVDHPDPYAFAVDEDAFGQCIAAIVG